MTKKPDEMPVIDHLDELRRLLIVSLVSTIVLAVAAWFFVDQILAFILDPLTNAGQHINYTGLTEPIIVKLKLSLFVGFVLALPIILWQVWGFVVPALKKNERVYFTLFVLVSSFCFILGVCFCYLSVFRFGIEFLLGFAGPSLNPLLTIDKFISFAIGIILPFGFIFELPLIAFILAKLGLLSYRFIAGNRTYAILIIVVVAALITPPDIFTCLMVTGPVYLLFELSALIVRLVERGAARKRKKEEAEEEKKTDDSLAA